MDIYIPMISLRSSQEWRWKSSSDDKMMVLSFSVKGKLRSWRLSSVTIPN